MSSSEAFLSHYTLDGMDRRILVGLSFEETVEFERLDKSLPYAGRHVWPFSTAIVPGLPKEVRWLELYRKHRAAFDAMQNKPVSRR